MNWIRHRLLKYCEDDHVDVTIAATGKEAIELVNNEEFDCIILDYTLPDISGTDLIQQSEQGKEENDTGDRLFCERF